MEGKFRQSSPQKPPGVDATDSGLSHPGKSIWRPKHRDEGPGTAGHGISGATTSLSQRGAQSLQAWDAVGQGMEKHSCIRVRKEIKMATTPQPSALPS